MMYAGMQRNILSNNAIEEKMNKENIKVYIEWWKI